MLHTAGCCASSRCDHVQTASHDEEIMSRMARPASQKPDPHQTFRLLARQYHACHEAVLGMVDELTQEQFRWRPAQGPQSVGWNLWHIARWDDYIAEVLLQQTASLSQLGPPRQVWKEQKIADRWGLDSVDLGL